MSTLRFGFAETDITPELKGTYLDGYGFRISPATGIKAPLKAKVMACLDGDSCALLYNIDLIGLNERLYRLVSSQISDFTGVPVSHIALNFIHTHAAPAAGILDELPIHYDYFGDVAEKCAEAAVRAMERAEAGTFASAVLPDVLHHAINRRGRDVIDPSIRASVFRNAEGVVKAVLCSASCHPVINTSMEVSPDWLAVLNGYSSDETPYLFFQGRGADINPYNPENLDMDAWIRALGEDLAVPVDRFAKTAPAGAPPSGALRVEYEWVRLPMADEDASVLKQEIRDLETEYRALDGVERHVRFREIRWRRHMLEMLEKGEDFSITVPLQCVAPGDALLFCMVPFELLTLLGNKIQGLAEQKGWSPEQIYVCGYSNAVYSYLPSEEEFPYGGYEVRGATHWYNLPECLPETGLELLNWFGRRIPQKH